MAKKTYEWTERVLWRFHNFVIGNFLGLRDACYVLDSVKKGKQVIFQVDFSDIHPYMFPGKTRQDLEDEKFSSHGLALKFMWDMLLGTNNLNWQETFSNLPFRLAMTPATRLEAIESLWHVEKRIYKKFRKYASQIIPHITFKKGGIEIPPSEKLFSLMQTWEHKKFLPKLRQAISDKTLEKALKQPIDNLTLLTDSKVLQNIEEYLPAEVLEDLLKSGYPDGISTFCEMCYSHRPRKSLWPREHDRFHDTVDDLNVALAYSLAESVTAEDFYIPLLTHSGRLIRIGAELMDYSKHLLVNHSLAPLYIARGTKEYSYDNVSIFLNFGKSLAYKMLKEAQQISNLQELLKLSYKDLAKRLKENRPVYIDESLMKKVQLFSDEYYDLINTVQEQTASDEEGQEEDLIPETVKIEHLRDLFNKTLKAAGAIRIAADSLNKILEQQNSVLSAIFNPIDPHAKEISEWLLRKDDIALDEEFMKI